MIAYGLAPHRIPVLCNQRIGDPAKDPLSVSWAAFCDHVRLIATSGRTPLRLTELSELLRRRQIPADPVLAVTIDGGAEETLAAARALAEHDVPVTAFVTPQAIDSPDHHSKAQFDDLVAMGERVEVGAHPGPSPRLDSLPADDSRASSMRASAGSRKPSAGPSSQSPIRAAPMTPASVRRSARRAFARPPRSRTRCRTRTTTPGRSPATRSPPGPSWPTSRPCSTAAEHRWPGPAIGLAPEPAVRHDGWASACSVSAPELDSQGQAAAKPRPFLPAGRRSMTRSTSP